MKRVLASVLALSVISIGLVGCGDKSKVEKKTTVSTPSGSQTTTQTTETKKTGDQK
jgi:predicted small lipoprotein YifL